MTDALIENVNIGDVGNISYVWEFYGNQAFFSWDDIEQENHTEGMNCVGVKMDTRSLVAVTCYGEEILCEYSKSVSVIILWIFIS